jgi:prepilin peptidase CpaA
MSDFITILLPVCGVGLLLTAALHDAATRTIPNWIPASLAVIGLASRVLEGEMIAGSAIAVAILALLIVLWLRGLIGGGDVKLIPAASLILPPHSVLNYILLVTVAGGILALLYLALSYLVRRPRPGQRRGLLARLSKAEAWRIHRRGPLPYAVAIATGAIPIVFKNIF